MQDKQEKNLTSQESSLIWVFDNLVGQSKCDLINVLNAEPLKYIIPLARWLRKSWRIYDALLVIENCVEQLIKNPGNYPNFLNDIKVLQDKQIKLRKTCIEHLISEQKYSVAREYILMELNSLCILNWSNHNNWYNWKWILDENKNLKSEVHIDKINLPHAKWFKDKLKQIEPMIPRSELD